MSYRPKNYSSLYAMRPDGILEYAIVTGMRVADALVVARKRQVLQTLCSSDELGVRASQHTLRFIMREVAEGERPVDFNRLLVELIAVASQS